ncbi:ring-1,2-phenylacetyl-CoA epoxidase subunit PaaE [Pseudarthrobacter enclensis]|uniref:Phenylacetic acid degradation protein n=1 Tax=Pseudarthrobacter enclensis TaxID=993070 RepID=A0A0V8I5D5_9MICC|nr:2Fe-2S iron-sulfur cluster-binding protein [Pseudarthrobacter enclensis]KSU70003.1 hypothetical protein AS031_18270 [Pseudarthrobacter enclensis]SCC30012.1 ring-1,2-phenylacetyl-CoA epoxidase subunit PaaE [Pseudarthrobacter enclensis]
MSNLTEQPKTGLNPPPAGFRALQVVGTTALTEDSREIEFAVPADAADLFAFLPGQHLTLHLPSRAMTERRTYSICSGRSEGSLRIGVRRIPGGALSPYLVDELEVGDIIHVHPPAGVFVAKPDPVRNAVYGAVASGSGITPILSITRTLLAEEPNSSVVLAYGNRDTSSVMFLEELADLKDRYPGRLVVHHFLSRERRGTSLDQRIEAGQLLPLFDALGGAPAVDAWYLCGPQEMVRGVHEGLANSGVDEHNIHTESFHTADTPRAPRPAPDDAGAHRVRAQLAGRESVVEVREGEFILDAVLRSRPEVPFACQKGVCGTCRARVTEGRAEMAANYALEQDDVDAGYILTCTSVPRGPGLELDFDA